MTDKLTPADAQSLIARADNPYRLDTSLRPVDWKEVRERFDPQGLKRKWAELVDTTFTVVELRPFDSSFEEGRQVVYWLRCVDENGELFNTVAGSGPCCEVLDAFAALNAEHHKAIQFGDDERAGELAELGAGRPFTVTLREVRQGKFGRYYTFE